MEDGEAAGPVYYGVFLLHCRPVMIATAPGVRVTAALFFQRPEEHGRRQRTPIFPR